MALVRECDICGCEIAARTNGYYRCTKVGNRPYECTSSQNSISEGTYVIRESDGGCDLEPIDICVNCFKEMVESKGKEI